MSVWLFQCNPDLFDLLADWRKGVGQSWSANQHRLEMRPNDRVFFRISGDAAGIYGVGTVLTTCYEAANEFGAWKVDVRYDSLVVPPLLIDEIKRIPSLKRFKPLLGQQGTNFRIPTEIATQLEESISTRVTGISEVPPSGHRGKPPPWERDELILALDLYLQHGRLDDTNLKVVELSQLLRNLPLHPAWRGDIKFRSPNSVAMKMANFQSLDPAYKGIGLDAGSKSDSQVWNELHDKPELVERLAQSIRNYAATPESELSDDDEDGAIEGRILTRVHRARERNQAMVQKRKKQRFEQRGSLTCEACDFDFAATYGERGVGFAECHHKVPLSESGETKTRIEDLAVLCANCHRMIHVRKPMITVDELRSVLAKRGIG